MMDSGALSDGNVAQSVADTEPEAGAASTVSRRKAIGGFAFYGAAMALAGQAASARAGNLGSHSSAAVALPASNAASDSIDELAKAVKIGRAMRAGPLEITRNATVAEMDHHGNLANILRPGTNGWVCVPGDE